METDEFFTIKEKDLLFSLYRKLLQLSGETLQKGDCKKLKTHLVNTILYRTTVSSVIYSV